MGCNCGKSKSKTQGGKDENFTANLGKPLFIRKGVKKGDNNQGKIPHETGDKPVSA